MTTQLNVVDNILSQFQISLENQDFSMKFLNEWVLNQNMSIYEFYYWEDTLEPVWYDPKVLVPYSFEGIVLILRVGNKNYRLVSYDHTTKVERIYLSRSRKSVMVQYTAFGYDEYGHGCRISYTSNYEYKSLLK